MEALKCFKCGSDKNIIKHHISYNPEIIVDCCGSCHKRIHLRVRKEGLCPLSVKETTRLSKNSNMRRNARKYTQKIKFYEPMLPYIRLYEEIDFNKNTGNFSVSSGFLIPNDKKLPVEEI